MSSHSPDSFKIMQSTAWGQQFSHHLMEARVTSTLVASRQIDAVAMDPARAEMRWQWRQKWSWSCWLNITHGRSVSLMMQDFCCIYVQPLKTLIDIMTGATKEGVASWTVATVKGKTVFSVELKSFGGPKAWLISFEHPKIEFTSIFGLSDNKFGGGKNIDWFSMGSL